ncbi:maleylpyruvate isomerase N-terminal domain-containing protein [Sphaerisporangium sp. TRM90804]|uniref:maleylpyruvate isomerase N-terminal domain-containing protein n=1 Tax=Sphaerisporangium sp. TRM90804 TaxID=3031113 RepID=UPI0024489E57|nr:maleylpyruvate isomerase N-terminal domain-containing protein [Sphaerisporangium sp. TRM90804]MDH2427682.1 maleylpyruvate isomerase N-terminal domain-containing protein [Sphaerisporangium sp. TRM90804]
MAGSIEHARWDTVRRALRDAGERFAAMVGDAPYPDAMATREWTIAESAAHVTAIAWLYTAVARGDDTPSPFPGLAGPISAVTVDGVAALNELAMEQFPERDPRVLAELLRAHIGEVLRATENLDPALPITWLGDSRVPLAGVLAHLVNELLVHGWDIARAARAPWPMPPHEAALFFDLFLVGMMRHDVGHLLDHGQPARDRRVAVRFHSRHTAPATLVLRGGRVWVEDPGPGVDAHVGFDPATLNLMLFGRVSKPRAALTGKLVVWGRRPWLLPVFLRTVRLPANARARARPLPQPASGPA